MREHATKWDRMECKTYLFFSKRRTKMTMKHSHTSEKASERMEIFLCLKIVYKKFNNEQFIIITSIH